MFDISSHQSQYLFLPTVRQVDDLRLPCESVLVSKPGAE